VTAADARPDRVDGKKTDNKIARVSIENIKKQDFSSASLHTDEG
jgi:hypothetical protein